MKTLVLIAIFISLQAFTESALALYCRPIVGYATTGSGYYPDINYGNIYQADSCSDMKAMGKVYDRWRSFCSSHRGLYTHSVMQIYTFNPAPFPNAAPQSFAFGTSDRCP